MIPFLTGEKVKIEFFANVLRKIVKSEFLLFTFDIIENGLTVRMKILTIK